MAQIFDPISKISTDLSLSQLLADDFPGECLNLPISGGWGYSHDDAIVISRFRSQVEAKLEYVSLQHNLVQKILYEELIIFRHKGQKFKGIMKSLIKQKLLKIGEENYDCLEFLISCWSELHWDQLRSEWEANEFGMRQGFDIISHESKREALRVQYSREFWFDITAVFSDPLGASNID